MVLTVERQQGTFLSQTVTKCGLECPAFHVRKLVCSMESVKEERNQKIRTSKNTIPKIRRLFSV
jgi:hypothetical protein